MKHILILVMALTFGLVLVNCSTEAEYRTITLEEYRNKMKAGWLGQMAGV